MPKQNPSDMSGDILSQLIGVTQQTNNEQFRVLNSIDASLKQMIQDGRTMSQANGINSYGRSSSYAYKNPKYSSFNRGSSDSEAAFDVRKIEEGVISELTQSILRSRGLRGMFDSIIQSITGPVKTSVTRSTLDLLDGIEHQMKVASGKSQFSKRLQGFLDKLAEDLGVEKKDIKKAIGREIGKKLLGNSEDLSAITNFWKSFSTRSIDTIRSTYETAVKNAVARDSEELESAKMLLQESESELKNAQAGLVAAQKRLQDMQSEKDKDKGKEKDKSEVKPDSSEASESAKKQKSKGSNEHDERVKVDESAITAQVCNITAQHVNINVNGRNLSDAIGNSKPSGSRHYDRISGVRTDAYGRPLPPDELLGSSYELYHLTQDESVRGDYEEYIKQQTAYKNYKYEKEHNNEEERNKNPKKSKKPDMPLLDVSEISFDRKQYTDQITEFQPMSEITTVPEITASNEQNTNAEQNNSQTPEMTSLFDDVLKQVVAKSETVLNVLNETVKDKLLENSEIARRLTQEIAQQAQQSSIESYVSNAPIELTPRYSEDEVKDIQDIFAESEVKLAVNPVIYKKPEELIAESGISSMLESVSGDYSDFINTLKKEFSEFEKIEQARLRGYSAFTNAETSTYEYFGKSDNLENIEIRNNPNGYQAFDNNLSDMSRSYISSGKGIRDFDFVNVDYQEISPEMPELDMGENLARQRLGSRYIDPNDLSKQQLQANVIEQQSEVVTANEDLVAERKQKVDDIEQGEAFDGLQSVFNLIKGKSEELLKSNKLTSAVYDSAKKGAKSDVNNLFGTFSKAFQSGKDNYLMEHKLMEEGAIAPNEMSGLNGIISTLTGTAEGATEAGAAMSGMLSGVTGTLSALGPEALVVMGAFKLVTGVLKNAFAPAIEGAKKLFEATTTALNRYHLSQKKNIEYAQKRLLEDINTLVSTPFDILRKGAEEWYSAWDNNLRTINATQGYTKSDLQDLMASFADRLRNEGLTSVVSATDITNNLTKVLQSGLSGEIAEEFAYIATKLNAAVPTQDFFGYADTYASIAANAVRTGMSQTAAIEYANQQLTSFANNVLYASREVAGGFTTGLKNAESLFKQSVQIAQAGKTYNASEISGVLTAVSAITGAIAPDLANAMTDAIYKAAVGGNNSDIVALRSLAGGNASNTEFLRDLTSNPKKVFSELFRELSDRQNMSADAFMEVAEGLSGIFGVSAEAFARVDFAYLAQAIESMDTSSKALIANMDLLKSGETTTNSESMKMKQINKMILDEGLSYVLDNEAARAIQQHMWDEQLARELQETEYGVNLHGAALELLEGIRHAVDTITTLLNPFKLIGKISSLFATSEEDDALKTDIAKIIELGKVGEGNARAKYNLTSYREDLNVVDDLTTMMGSHSRFKEMHEVTELLENVPSYIGADYAWDKGGYQGDETRKVANSPSSKWAWSTVGKSQALAAFEAKKTDYELEGIDGIKATQTASETLQETTNTTVQSLQKMLNSMESFVKSNPTASYEDWVQTSRSFGIADFEQVVKDSSLTNDQISNQYAILQAQVDMKQQRDRQKSEEEYWGSTTESLTTVSENTKLTSESVSGADGILGKLDIATNALTSISETYLNVNTKVDSIDIKMDSIKSSIDSLGSTAISDEIMDKLLTDVNAIVDTTNGIYGKSHAMDDNRANPTGWDLSVAGWLQFIYNKLADDIDPHIVEVVDNTGNVGNGYSEYQGSASDNREIVEQLKTIANILISIKNGSGFEVVNGEPRFYGMKGMATAGTGY